MKDVYILLTCTGTVFSRAIKYFTRCNFTHASIALDLNCSQLYSFARKQMFPPLPAGFTKEDISKGILAKYAGSNCALYRVSVDEDTYTNISRQISLMSQCEDSFQYNCLGPICCFFRIPYHSGQKYFCSEFVADILQSNGALRLPKPASLFHPSDFTEIEDLELIYEGSLRQLNRYLDSEYGNSNEFIPIKKTVAY